MIPAQAVEAAAKAAFSLGNDMQDWGKVPEVVRARYLEQATLALEAAAPHMMAEVLEEAACAAEDPSPEDMDTYFIDQADVGRWLRDRAEAYRPTDAR